MDEPILDLRETLAILWRRRVILVVVLAVTLGLTLAWSQSRPKTYQAYAELVVRPVVQPGGFTVYGSSAGRTIGPDISIESQSAIVNSPVVARRVADALSLDVPPEMLSGAVRVNVVTEELLGISATAGDPQLAADLANGFANEYLNYRQIAVSTALEQVIEELESNIEALVKKIGPYEDRIVRLTVENAALENEPNSPENARQIAENQSRIDRMKGERNEIIAETAILRIRVEEVRATRAGTTGGGEVVTPAQVPLAPASPNPIRDGLMGLALGLVLAAAVVFIRHRLDDRLRTYADVDREMDEPIVGAIPRVRGWQEKKESYLAVAREADSPASEAYRSLRQTLVAMGMGRSMQRLLVTSGGPGAGKSSTAANLAVAAARSGLSVIVVSADLRRPRVEALLGAPQNEGLAGILAGNVTLDDVLVPSSHEGIKVIPSGPPPADPSRALDSAWLDAVLREASDQCDLLLIDSPPLVSGADPLVLAPRSDMTLLVLRRGSARLTGTQTAVAQLRGAGAERVALIVNLAEANAVTRARYAAYRSLPVDEVMRTEHNGNGHARVAANGNGNGNTGGFGVSTLIAPEIEKPARKPRKRGPGAKPSK